MNQPFTPQNSIQPGFTFYPYNHENIAAQKCTLQPDGNLSCINLNRNDIQPKDDDLICTNYKNSSITYPDSTTIKFTEVIDTSQTLCYTFDFFKRNFLPTKITSPKFDNSTLDSINRRIFLSMNNPFYTPFNLSNKITVDSINPKSGPIGTEIVIKGTNLENKKIFLVSVPDPNSKAYAVDVSFNKYSNGNLIFNTKFLIPAPKTNTKIPFSEKKGTQFGVFVYDMYTGEMSYINNELIFTLT